MFTRLRHKLVFVYTVSTGIILLLILAVAFSFYMSASIRQHEAAFQNHLFSLSVRLQSDSRFIDDDLAHMELKNQLLISIEENGTPLFFSGAYRTRTDRDTLIKRAEIAAEENGISTDSRPLSSQMRKSPLLHIKGEHNDSYLASVLMVRSGDGYKKLVFIGDETQFISGLFATGFLYLLIGAAGIVLLFLTGRRFVRRALSPLEKNYKKQQEFVSAASHELRSPLSVIKMSAAAIDDAPGQSRKLASTIRNECQRGSSLIKNLLLLASADENTLDCKKAGFEIDELLLNLLELYEPMYSLRGASLLLELPDTPLPDVYADPELCRQILVILLENALAYGLGAESHSRVALKASYADKYVTVSVVDHGPGLDDKEKSLVFDRFYRKDKARSSKEHFGLGLSIAAGLAKLQNIRLYVEDTEGGGCTFSVRLPEHAKLQLLQSVRVSGA